LGEAVKCFIDQTYPNKELIVVNDQEGVTLKLSEDRDDIRMENVSTRFDSLGQKRNYAMSLTKGDYVCIWDDDDLFPPWRIEDSVDAMRVQKRYDIVKGQMALMSVDNSKYMIVNNLFHSQAMILRNYVDSHSYPDKSVGEDMDYERPGRVGSVPVAPFYWYIYRWGLNIHHLSGITDEQESWKRSLTFEPYTSVRGEIEINPEFTDDHWGNIINTFRQKKPSYAEAWKNRLEKSSK